jgi:hypothetical protein
MIALGPLAVYGLMGAAMGGGVALSQYSSAYALAPGSWYNSMYAAESGTIDARYAKYKQYGMLYNQGSSGYVDTRTRMTQEIQDRYVRNVTYNSDFAYRARYEMDSARIEAAKQVIHNRIMANAGYAVRWSEGFDTTR